MGPGGQTITDRLHPKRVLVTGGAGFLGSHLCEQLLKLQYEVLCVDNFYTGSKSNLSRLADFESFELMRHDVSLPLYVEVDEIYNFACPASPVQYQKNPLQTIKTSIHGAVNMLGLARRLDAKIFQASTSEVYGDPLVHPQAESYWGHVNATGPRACYDESKRCAETLFFDHWRRYKTRIKVARLFNTYGPYMNPADGRVVSNFICQALTGRQITIYGEGGQTRSFCYVDDLINGCMRLMNSDDDFVGPVNLGNPEEISIRELAETVVRMTGSRSRLVFRPIPQDDPVRRQPDITVARKALAWQPRTRLEEGLAKTIEYFDQLLRQPGYKVPSAVTGQPERSVA